MSRSYLQICMSFIFMIIHFQPDIFSIIYPNLLTHYNFSPENLHYCASIFYYSCAITVIFAAFIAEYIKIKKTLYISFIIIIVSLLLITISDSLIIFAFSRFLHGVGIAIPTVLGVSILFNELDEQQFKKAVYLNNSLIMIAKALAPLLGTYINEKFSWQYICFLLAILTILAIFFLYFVNIKTTKTEIISISKTIHYYKSTILSKNFISYCIILALLSSPLTLFINTTPIIFVAYYKIDPFYYAYLRSSIMIMFALFGFIASFYLSRISLNKIIVFAFISIISGVILINLYPLLEVSQIVPISTIALIFCSAGYATLIPVFMSKAMKIAPPLANYSSSCIAFFRLLIVGLSTSTAGFFFTGTVSTIAIFCLLSLITILILNYFLIKNTVN